MYFSLYFYFRMPRVPKIGRNTLEWIVRRVLAALFQLCTGVSRATTAIQYGLSKRQVQYWTERLTSQEERSSWGGPSRRQAFTPEEAEYVERLIITFVRTNPTTTQKEIIDFCRLVRLPSGRSASISKGWLYRLFKSYCWSCRKRTVVSWLKYTQENIAYYEQFLTTARQLPWLLFKYLDEVHFDPVDCSRRRTYGGDRSTRAVSDAMNNPRYSVTVLTSLDAEDRDAPIILSFRRLRDCWMKTAYECAFFLPIRPS
jgi:hypothetical protein